jgi:hypothetical protein
MPANQLNVLSGGLLGFSTAPDATESVMPTASRSLAGFSPFGYIAGKWEGWADYELKYLPRWKGDDLGVPTSAGLSVQPASASTPSFLRIASGTVASTGRQVQSSDGTTTAAFAKIFPKAGQFQHAGFRYRPSSSSGSGFLIGLAEVNVSVITAAGAINAANGIFLHKASASATVNLIVRIAGATVVTIALTTTNTTNQWYECWYRFDSAALTVWFTDVTAGTQTIQTVDTSGSFAAPAAALALSIAAVNGATTSTTLDIQTAFAFAEAY